MAKELNCLGIVANLKSSQQLEQDLNSRPPLTTRLRYIPPIGERVLFMSLDAKTFNRGLSIGQFPTGSLAKN